MMLSADIQGLPERITARIYLWKEENREKEPELIAEYAIMNNGERYDMKVIM